MGRATHSVVCSFEAKGVVRIGVAASPWACVGCAVELVLRIAPGSFLFWWRGLWRARARAPAAQPPPPPSAPLGVGVGPAHPAPGSALVLSLAELFIFLPDLGLALRRHAARVYLKAVKTPCPRFAVRGPPAYGSPPWLLASTQAQAQKGAYPWAHIALACQDVRRAAQEVVAALLAALSFSHAERMSEWM
jgi:hypothetical protein